MSFYRLVLFAIFCLLCSFGLEQCADGAPPAEMLWLFVVAIGLGYGYGTLQTRILYDKQIKAAIKSITDK